MLNRRHFNLLPLLGAFPSLCVLADTFPSKPIRFVAAFGAGTSTDALARLIAQSVARTLNGQVIVDNKVGAGGIIGTDFIAKSLPDGYNVLFTTSSFFALPFMGEKLPYDAFNDFTAVASVAQAGVILAVAADSPLRTAQDLIAEAKKRPGALSYCTSGQGSTTHMAGAAFNAAAGINMKAIHYKSSAQANIDVSTGDVTLAISGIGLALTLIKAGKLRPLAVTSTRRSDALPDVPTLSEGALPNFEVVTPVMSAVRAGTPKPIVAALSKAILAAAATSEFKTLCNTLVLDVLSVDDEALAAALPREFAKWKTMAELATKQG